MFSLIGLTTQIIGPVGLLTAGFLSEYVFSSLLTAEGALASTVVAEIIGVGPTRGNGLMLVLVGVIGVVLAGVYAALPATQRLHGDQSKDVYELGEVFWERIAKQGEVFISLSDDAQAMCPVMASSPHRRRVTVEPSESAFAEQLVRNTDIDVQLAPDHGETRKFEFERREDQSITLKHKTSPQQRKERRFPVPEGSHFSVAKKGGTSRTGSTTSAFQLWDEPVELRNISRGGLAFICQKDEINFQVGDRLKIQLQLAGEDLPVTGSVHVEHVTNTNSGYTPQQIVGGEWAKLHEEDRLDNQLQKHERKIHLESAFEAIDDIF
ncbi:MAG: PilZ domain-containing protein [Bradymonadaceae bacterium]